MDWVTTLAVQGLHGMVYGMLLFLVASGLTLIFGMMGVLNFAHGALYMLGAYFSFSVLRWSGSFWVSLRPSNAFSCAKCTRTATPTNC
jgi:branched-chain amino acid transport system permease protein